VVLKWSRCSAVSIKTKLRDERRRKHSLIPSSIKRFFSSQKRPEQPEGSLSLLYNRYWRGAGAFPVIKRPGVKQTTALPVALRLGMSGAVPLPPCIPSLLAHRATLPLNYLTLQNVKISAVILAFLGFLGYLYDNKFRILIIR
jgi:hypothetical protein